MNLKTIVQGFGAAMLLMISHLVALVSPYNSVLYHSVLPISSLVWGTLIDLAALSVLVALLFAYLQRRQTGVRTLVWVLVAAPLVRNIVVNMGATLGWSISRLTLLMAFAVALLGALALWWLRPRVYQATVRGLLVLLFLAGCNAVWMVPELLYKGARAQQREVPTSMNQPAGASDPRDPAGRDQRIVWLLFDELSYDQTFEHRFEGLTMPHFDEFRSKSVVFSDLKPAGNATDLVIPSFFLGKPVSKIRSDLEGKPMLRLAGGTQWQAFDAHATLFSDAQRLGWRTGVVGWYNPYCRILTGTLDSCFWRMGDGEFRGPVSTQSTLENAISPIREVARWLARKPGFTQQIHAEDLAAITQAATDLIRNPNISFLFIHLPIPHQPGIYDRRTGTFGSSGTYIDNLALSDRVLGELMKSVNATPLASKTTVIICSDHSWRLSIWRAMPYWTKEDEAASRGRFDPRPVLMIHFPGQEEAREVTAPFDSIRIHEIIEHLLRGQQPGFDRALMVGTPASPVASTR